MSRPSASATRGDSVRGLSSRETTRLVVLFIFAAVMTSAMLVFRGRATGTPVEDLRPAEAPEAVADVRTPARPWNPPKDAVEGLVFEATREQRVRLYPEALNLLAPLVFDWPHHWFRADPELAAVRGFHPFAIGDLADIAHASSRRCLPVDITGRVLQTQALQPEEDLQLTGPIFERLPILPSGTIEGPDGAVARFILFDRVQPTMLMPGERVRVQGVFFRLEDIAEPQVDGTVTWRTVPLILAKKVSTLIPLQLVDELPLDLAESIRDATEEADAQRVPHKEYAFYQLLGYALKHFGERSKTPPIRLEGKGPVQRPSDYRLAPVRVEGQVVYHRWESFEYPESRESDAPLLGYWHVIVSHPVPELNAPVSLIVPTRDLPPEFDIGRKVEVDGIYYRVHTYRSRPTQTEPSKYRITPLVVLTALPVPVTIPRGWGPEPLILGFIATGFLLTGGLFWLVRRDRSRSRDLEAHLRQRRGQRHIRDAADRGLDRDGRSPGV